MEVDVVLVLLIVPDTKPMSDWKTLVTFRGFVFLFVKWSGNGRDFVWTVTEGTYIR